MYSHEWWRYANGRSVRQPTITSSANCVRPHEAGGLAGDGQAARDEVRWALPSARATKNPPVTPMGSVPFPLACGASAVPPRLTGDHRSVRVLWRYTSRRAPTVRQIVDPE